MQESINGVMIQGFHWFLDKDDRDLGSVSLWKFIKNQADHFRDIGIDAVWIPPCYKGGSEWSNGYDVYDHFDLGEFDQKGGKRTKHGTKQELHAAINALHGYKKINGNLVKDGDKKYIHVYGDIVVNHKMNGDPEDYYWDAIRVEPGDRTVERWGPGYETGQIKVKGNTKFDHKARHDRYSSFRWHTQHFDGIDTEISIQQNGNTFTDRNDYLYRFLYNEENYHPASKNWDDWVDLEKGNYDYLMGNDLDFGRYDVREEIKYWGEWITKEIGLDGFRLDAVKHINADFIREWLGHVRWKTGKSLFAIGEYLCGYNTGPMHSFIRRVTSEGEYPQDISLFDFPLQARFRNASWEGDRFDLSSLNYGTLMTEQPTKAVTFVENHDKEYGRSMDSHVQNWFKPLAYAFILLREKGYPCLFFYDYYGAHYKYDSNGSTVNHTEPDGKGYLDFLLKLRKQFALGEERYYSGYNVAGWVRMGFVPGAKGAMAVVINNTTGVRAIGMDTGRVNKRFYHLATIKYTGSDYLIVKYRYDMYGDKAEGLYTNSNGWADFPADGGTVSIWIEDGAGLD